MQRRGNKQKYNIEAVDHKAHIVSHHDHTVFCLEEIFHGGADGSCQQEEGNDLIGQIFLDQQREHRDHRHDHTDEDIAHLPILFACIPIDGGNAFFIVLGNGTEHQLNSSGGNTKLQNSQQAHDLRNRLIQPIVDRAKGLRIEFRKDHADQQADHLIQRRCGKIKKRSFFHLDFLIFPCTISDTANSAFLQRRRNARLNSIINLDFFSLWYFLNIARISLF